MDTFLPFQLRQQGHGVQMYRGAQKPTKMKNYPETVKPCINKRTNIKIWPATSRFSLAKASITKKGSCSMVSLKASVTRENEGAL